MAATNSTNNNVLFWAAQAQGNCPHCKEPLVGEKPSDVYDLTFDHASGNYDHKKRKERGKKSGGEFIHKSCHKSKTMRELEIWKKRK